MLKLEEIAENTEVIQILSAQLVQMHSKDIEDLKTQQVQGESIIQEKQ